ncbi:tigger transposable element-derived protein 2-like [Leptopilina boulardi]|uniref:tigger transposable element-derived protein 2-like n=1 Tax=Leptopilina boulardi TaxID=63433 RepID=UPI0021F5E2F9|nr:tigger transposable element-derived protein 2-like [Leptopilina boulardi]XP_051168090.1 tigger transposable element-derived protein 2-like [Leptopilina boulardi]
MNLQTVAFTPFNDDLLKTPQAFAQQCKVVYKRNHMIPLCLKYEILQRMKNGATLTNLSKEYNIPRSTIGRIRKMEGELEKFCHEKEHINGMSKRKRLQGKKGDIGLDSCMEIWYQQNYYLGNLISGKMLQEKALEFNVKLNGPKTFKASNGWLQSFKTRCGIKKQHRQDEKRSINSGTACEFQTKFSQALKNDKYPLDNIYSADENILWWKTFPKKSTYERNAPKVTLVICANATGSHKIPLMIIGRSKIPWSLKTADKLPIKYKAQESSWIDMGVFTDWLKTIFVPSVKKRQQQDGKSGSIVLLLDSAACRYVSETNLTLSGILLKLVLLPMNLTSDVLPMNQGIIEKLKIIYRQNFLKEVLQRGIKADIESVNEFLKTWNLRDSCHILKSAWESVSSTILIQSWRKVCTEDMFEEQMEIECDPHDTHDKPELLNLLKRIPGYEDCNENDTNNWLDDDSSEYDDDDEKESDCAIIVKGKKNSLPTEIIKDVDNSKSELRENNISTVDAIASLENVIRWMNHQDDLKNDIFYVTELCEKIKKKLN